MLCGRTKVGCYYSQIPFCLLSATLLLWFCMVIYNIVQHEVVPEVSKGKVHITQNKHVPIGIDCDFLNTFHSISRAPFLDVDSNDAVKRTTLYYKELQSTTPYYSLVQSTTSVLLRTTKYYSSTILYYKVLLPCCKLLQYYSVLQNTTPVLLCTTKYYSVLQSLKPVLQSTTPYYKVLICSTKYYCLLQSTTPVPQSSTPVLLCTTKYYSSTILYYSSTNV